MTDFLEPTEADHVIPFDRLPPRFAESLEHPPEVPVEARPAATIVLLRDGRRSLEVLMMRRNRSSGFVPGAYVFPGGRVDAADAEEAALERMDGLTAEAAAHRLGLHDADPPAIAYYLAALREAFEETGILVAHGPDGEAPRTAAEDTWVDDLRDDVMEDRISFADALEQLGCRIEGSSVEYMAHWITPEVEPRRYDTRFFAAKARPGATPIVDPREMTDALWITPEAAMTRNRAGTLPMVFPTIKTLQRLMRYATVDAALEAFRARTVPTILPRLVVTPTGVGMELDAEP